MGLISNKWRKLLVVATTVLLASTSVSIAPVVSHAESHHKYEHCHIFQEDWKYPIGIMIGVTKTLMIEQNGQLNYREVLSTINDMSKVEVMDSYLTSYRRNIKSGEIRRIVKQIYKIDLDRVSELGAGKQTSTYPAEIVEGVKEALSKQNIEDIDTYIQQSLTKVEVMDLYLESYGKRINGPEIRIVINQIFGINLEGISNLEGTGVSLFSKDQWISQYDQDLFVVHTGLTDVDVWIYPTEYFTEQTGLTELPAGLQKALKGIGFNYSEEAEAFYYANPTGKSVPDQFKGRTIGTLIGFIQKNYKELME